MAIDKKLIHFDKLADFEAQLTAGNILDRSIVFIKDAKKIWTHGTYYDCSEGGASESGSNYYITEFTYNDFYNAASENGQLQISENDATGLMDSINSGSRILIPYGGNVIGYAIMLGENDMGEVYVAVYSTRDVITAFFFQDDILQGNKLTFDNDVTISNAIIYETAAYIKPFTLAVRGGSGEVEANGIVDSRGMWWVTPSSSEEDRNSADGVFQQEITDLDVIREGAAKGAEALQGLDNFSDTLTNVERDIYNVDQAVKALATVASTGSYNDLSDKPTIPAAYDDTELSNKVDGLVDLTDSFNSDLSDLYEQKQDNLVSGTNIKTINGESILGSGDLTIEGGAKVYEWFYDGESKSVLLSQEEYDNIVEANIVVVNVGGAFSFAVGKSGKEFSEAVGNYGLIGQIESEGVKVYINISIDISTKVATIIAEEQEILTKTSQLENDSNFVSSDGLKTINGESIVGSGDITISGGGVSEDYVNTAIANAITTTLNTAV